MERLKYPGLIPSWPYSSGNTPLRQGSFMIELRPFQNIGHVAHGWLDARHHFSFADYQDPGRMGWGSIRVWNDDEIAAGTGFAPHPHQDMEIITYVRSGAISHEDSMGNKGRTGAGDVQVMSAGSGVRHSEFNHEAETTSLFQIWIIPRERGGAPFWDARPFPKEDRSGQWVILASGYEGDDGLPIRADARVLGATLKTGAALDHTVAEGRHAYLVPATGRVQIGDVTANMRDGVAFSAGKFTIVAAEDSELVLVDAP
jgi:quercetin 2,3-dioxygenase